MAKVLLVEDDRNLAGTVREWLEFEHYLVEWVETGTDALDMMKSYKYDVIIMDLTLPKMDGIEVCKNFRQQGGETPILILTGRGTVPDKELGFDAGADDYLTKPFHLKELSARIRALLRRPKDFAGEVLKAGNIALDIGSHSVTKEGKDIHLPRMEFALLEFLMRHKGQVFSAEALLDRVWTADSDKSPETIRTSVKKLRSKIDTKGEPSLIRNVHGVGYKLEG
ncbi:MAG: response regulator transcription factor [Cyanobacteriota/Melainabacteria group bacterium]|nr:response regulator transcription factor [Cyanobacteria bacterium HKST-UBA01]MCB9470721.1 response regulator transcription factor [Candidatus Obscuribacterales bacterium]